MPVLRNSKHERFAQEIASAPRARTTIFATWSGLACINMRDHGVLSLEQEFRSEGEGNLSTTVRESAGRASGNSTSGHDQCGPATASTIQVTRVTCESVR